MKSIYLKLLLVMIAISILTNCGGQMQNPAKTSNVIEERLKEFTPVLIKADLSKLDEKKIKMIKLLAEAGHLANEIFWKQSSIDGIKLRDELKNKTDDNSKSILKYLTVHFGPYDRIYHSERFYGEGPKTRPEMGTYYPQDITKEEFEAYIKAHPDKKEALESQYTVVKRDGKDLIAVPFHKEYPEVQKIAKLLDEASELADHPALKKYLKLRAKAILTDDYYESDMAWMDITDSDIDVVIGPIENYEDGLFNYKTAYECAVLVKDFEATKELEVFKSNINKFEQLLPYDKKYIRTSAGGSDNILSIMNIVYFGGDCQKAVKTIASSLPNDPKVTDAKGGKKQMFKNMMEAKFDNIVVPIAKKILDPALVPYVDKKAFTSFVTLHEVSHTLGRGFVFGNDTLTVRKSLQEKYSAIEETKADILGMYNHKHLLEMGLIDANYMKKAISTYIAGLYRSIRFGAEAHGQSNLVQLNFLMEQGAIKKMADGKLTLDEKLFFDKVAELAKIILTLQAEGDYKKAVEVLNKYGKMTPEIQKVIDSMKDIPRDLDTTYEF
jgi:hypothetical protein